VPEMRWGLDGGAEARGNHYADTRTGHQQPTCRVGLDRGHQLAFEYVAGLVAAINSGSRCRSVMAQPPPTKVVTR